MNTARIVALTIAVGADCIAACLASASDNKHALLAEPVARIHTLDVLAGRSDIGLGQSVKPEDLRCPTWPAATASNNFIRHGEWPDDRTRQTGTLSPALRNVTDLNAVETHSDNQALKRSESISVVRYDVSGPTTTPKFSKGCSI